MRSVRSYFPDLLANFKILLFNGNFGETTHPTPMLVYATRAIPPR
jgi:hypothetical protein